MPRRAKRSGSKPSPRLFRPGGRLLSSGPTRGGVNMRKSLKLLAAAAAAAIAVPAGAQQLRPDQVKFRELYQELVETNTTLSVGSCTQAAEQIAARLKQAGYSDDQITLFSV